MRQLSRHERSPSHEARLTCPLTDSRKARTVQSAVTAALQSQWWIDGVGVEAAVLEIGGG